MFNRFTKFTITKILGASLLFLMLVGNFVVVNQAQAVSCDWEPYILDNSLREELPKREYNGGNAFVFKVSEAEKASLSLGVGGKDCKDQKFTVTYTVSTGGAEGKRTKLIMGPDKPPLAQNVIVGYVTTQKLPVPKTPSVYKYYIKAGEDTERSIQVVYVEGDLPPVVKNQASTDPTKREPVEIAKITNLFGPSATTVQGVATRVINVLLALIVIAAVIVIVISGFRMVVGGSNPDQLKKAKAGILWSLVGLAVAFMSFAIVQIIQGLL